MMGHQHMIYAINQHSGFYVPQFMAPSVQQFSAPGHNEMANQPTPADIIGVAEENDGEDEKDVGEGDNRY